MLNTRLTLDPALTVKELLSKTSPCAEILRVTAGPGGDEEVGAPVVVGEGLITVTDGICDIGAVVEGAGVELAGLGVCDVGEVVVLVVCAG